MRSFFRSFMGVLGAGCGLIPVLLLIGLAFSGTQASFPVRTSAEVLPNHLGKRKGLDSSTPIVLRLHIGGFIGSEKLSAEIIRTQLMESREGALKGKRVKAIFLTINSAGGTVDDSEQIYQSIMWYKKRYNVPVYAYLDGIAASGGYYIALAADKIYASRTSLVGSIGVLIRPFMNFTKVLDKIGVETKNISMGKGKDALNPFRPWEPTEADSIEGIAKYYYDLFVGDVVERRPGVERSTLIDTYGADVFPAPTAAEYSLVDNGDSSMEEALEALVTDHSLGSDYQVVSLKISYWVTDIFRGQANFLRSGLKHELAMPPEYDSKYTHPIMYYYRPSTM